MQRIRRGRTLRVVEAEQASADAACWSRMAAGDRDALGELFDRHHRAVYNHCFRLTASWATAEDLASQVFMEAWRQRGRFVLRSDSARPWLLTVGTNLARNELRSMWRRHRLTQRIGRLDDEPDPSDDIAGRIDDERRMAQILELVRRLPRAEREVVALCIWSGVSYADAAAALNIAESSVRARVSRARRRLAEAAHDEGIRPLRHGEIAAPEEPR